MAFVARAKPALRIVPLVNNFDAATLQWQSEALATMLASSQARRHAIDALLAYVRDRHFAGVNLDFENVPARSRAHLVQFARELHAAFHPLGLEVSQSVPLDDPAFDYPQLAQASDYLILMAYDEHTGDGDAGSVASQAWYSQTLERRVEEVTPGRLVVALGSYGYDWIDGGRGAEVSFQEAVRTAAESEGHIGLDEDSLNPTYDYFDDHDRLHHVWFLNGVTVFNQVHDASDIDLRGYALWRLGSEDPSVWTVFDHRSHLDEPVARALSSLRYGYDIDYEGQGEVLRVIATPREGRREVKYDSASGLITDERLLDYPSPYVIERRGMGAPKAIALTFDDGPDARWTPQILDVLRARQAPATFFVIGVNADQNPALLQRMIREGHEVGNHTFTHPDISAITRQQLRLEINATERLLESVIGRRSLLFRPPYAEDIEPETPDQVNPLLYTSSTGYYTIGLGVDPNDWTNPGTDRIVQDTIDGANAGRGHVVLLHDGGGDRSQTVGALPGIIDGLRARGYSLVTVSSLVGLSRDAIMPPVTAAGLVVALADRCGVPHTRIRERRAPHAVPDRDRPCDRPSDRHRYARHLAASARAPASAVSIVARARRGHRARVQRIEGHRSHRSVAARVGGCAIRDPRRGRWLDRWYGRCCRISVWTRHARPRPAQAEWWQSRSAELRASADRRAHRRRARRRYDLRTGRGRPSRPGVSIAARGSRGRERESRQPDQSADALAGARIHHQSESGAACVRFVERDHGRPWRGRRMATRPGARSRRIERRHARRGCRSHNADPASGVRDVYEDAAIAWTEAPDTVQGLLKQRFRWVFGTLQAAWKQRDTLFRPRYGALGLAAMPNLIVFQVLFPLVSPMMDLQMLASLIAAALQRHQHPAEFSADILNRTLFFYALFVVVDLAAGALAFVLERKEDWKLLLWLPLQRFAYRQLMCTTLS